MVTKELLAQHQAQVDFARRLSGSFTMKALWCIVLFGVTGTASVTGYTLSTDSGRPEKAFTLSIPTSGVNLLKALDDAGIWDPTVVDVIITEVATSNVYYLPCGESNLGWSTITGETRMSEISVADYDEAEIRLNV